MKIAYLGPAGTYTETVARDLFKHTELLPIGLIGHIIEGIDDCEFSFGVVPIENLYEGEVRETLDSLTAASDAKIIKESVLQIVHCLGVLPEHGEIKEVLSKDQALGQCRRYLARNYPGVRTIATSSTAEAARIIYEEKRLNAAAIASEEALGQSGLEVLAKDLRPNNKTRFVVVARDHFWDEERGDDKTLIAIHPRIDRPGILHDTLGFFKGFGINLEYIQSRPDGDSGYIFYCELDGYVKDEPVARAISAVRFSLDPKGQYSDTVKVLGSFANSHWKK